MTFTSTYFYCFLFWHILLYISYFYISYSIFSFVTVPVSPLFMHSFVLFWSILRPETETILHYCWRVKSSFKLVWMESSSPCNSLFGYSLKVAPLLIGLTHISDKSQFFSLLEEINRLLDCQLWFHNNWSYSTFHCLYYFCSRCYQQSYFEEWKKCKEYQAFYTDVGLALCYTEKKD